MARTSSIHPTSSSSVLDARVPRSWMHRYTPIGYAWDSVHSRSAYARGLKYPLMMRFWDMLAMRLQLRLGATLVLISSGGCELPPLMVGAFGPEAVSYYGSPVAVVQRQSGGCLGAFFGT